MIRRPSNDEELVLILENRAKGYGNLAKLADVLDINPPHLRSMISGSMKVSMKVANALGYDLQWVKVQK